MALYSWLVSSSFSDYALSGMTIAVLAILTGVYTMQTKLIYIPHFPPGSRQDVWRPNRFGFEKFEEVTLTSSDGVRIHAFWIPARKVGSKSVPTVLFFHANAGNVGHRLPILRRLSDMVDVNFFALSYRGYGESEGSPNEVGIRRDAQAALDYVLSDLRDEIDPDKIVIYGQSIGGAVSIDLTARNQSKVAALIVENTFRSLPLLIPHVMPLLGWASSLCHQRWESEQRIREMLGAPLPRMLFLVGDSDELIPSSHIKTLFKIVSGTEEGKKKSRLEIFEKGTHNDTCLQPGYFEALATFIQSL